MRLTGSQPLPSKLQIKAVLLLATRLPKTLPADSDSAEQEALYDLLRLQSVMEDEHAEEIANRDAEIEHLKQMVEALARRQSKSFNRVSSLYPSSLSLMIPWSLGKHERQLI